MEEKGSLVNTLNSLGISSQYIIRKTGEEVEVIAFNQKESGDRSEEDWVSFIDSEGNEHIKKPLNIQFDFKATDKMSKWFDKLLDPPKYEPIKMPDPWDDRRFALVKDLVVERSWSVEEAIRLTDTVVDALTKKDKAPSEGSAEG